MINIMINTIEILIHITSEKKTKKNIVIDKSKQDKEN